MPNSVDEKFINPMSTVHSYIVKIIKKPLPTTAKMVDASLIELHSRKGVTMKKLNTFILSKYAIKSTDQRNSLIKKRLRELFETKDLLNITGRGLIGHFKLADKKKFTKKIENDSKRSSFISTKTMTSTNITSASEARQQRTKRNVKAKSTPHIQRISDTTAEIEMLSPITPVGQSMVLAQLNSNRSREYNQIYCLS